MKLSDDEVQRLGIASAGLPSGPWEVWTACSFRRITGPDRIDGGVLSGVVQRSDGHPDLSMDEEALEHLCEMINAVRSILNRDEITRRDGRGDA